MSYDSPAAQSTRGPTAPSVSWGYALGSGALCGAGAAVLMALGVGVIFFVMSVQEPGSDLGSTVTDGLASGTLFFVFAGVVAAIVGVPAGLVLGSVNGALVRTTPSPASALLLALVLAVPLGAALPTLVLGGASWLSWLSALSAGCAGVAAATQVGLLLRRAGRAEAEPGRGTSGDAPAPTP